jgi:glucosylceramidase
VTIDLTDPAKPAVKPEADYYVIGQATRFVLPGAVRIASDEPAGTGLKDVAFRNPNGTVVLYTVNNGTASQDIRIAFHGKTVAAAIPAGAVATFVWK